MSDFMSTVNFPLVLVIGTAISGLIWFIDSVLLGRKYSADMSPPLLVDYARSFFPVLLIVLILRSFLFEPFKIPSGSMKPTLLVGDFILVSKFSYGVRLPVIHTKILDTGSPERGDVAVFRFPADPRVDYIKRVVGLPGDTIVYENKIFTINDEVINISPEQPYVLPGTDAISSGVALREEQLGSVLHEILQHERSRSQSGKWVVPEGHYFMVGDNRDNSNDGRVWGFVPEANLVGKAKYVWMHWSDGVLWDRLGDKIR